MWLHLPTIQSASAPDTEELNLDSTRLSQLEQSAMWKSKFRQQRSWLLVWKKDISIRRLSGLTLKPSTLNHGVEKWISSQADSHVSHSVLQGKENNKTMIETSGQMSQNSLGDLGFQSSFLKMFPESSDTTGTPYDPNYKRWVTKLRKDSSRRQKQALLIKEKDFSSWRTPAASDPDGGIEDWSSERFTNIKAPQIKLRDQAANWPTPTTQEISHKDMEVNEKGRRMTKDKKDSHSLNLQDTTANWPTPISTDCSNRYQTENWRGDDLSFTSHEWTKTVLEEEERWPTPTVAEADKIGNRPNYGQKGLSNHPALVGKVERKKMNKSKAKDGKSTNPDKEEKSWPTPLQRDYKGMGTREKPTELYLSIPPDPKKQIDGHTCSVSCRRLNPHFAEWLMGLCLGWTSVSEPLEMELFQAWQQSLSELLQKISD